MKTMRGETSSRRRLAAMALAALSTLAHLGEAQSSSVQESEAASSTPSSFNRVWLGADGRPVPFRSHREILDFLAKGEVVSSQTVSTGITKPRKVLLRRGEIRMHALFRDVRRVKRVKLPRSGRVLELRDDRIFECAAYHLSRMLGLDSVPPVVRRRIDDQDGTLQVWIERSVMERNRHEADSQAPSEDLLLHQYRVMWIFDNLIFNDDRNKGNVLFDESWKLWMIDHTQAFRVYPELPYPGLLSHCEKDLFHRLRALDADFLRRRLGPFLEPAELEGLVQRRELIVELIQELIEEKGEEGVLYSVRSR